MQYFVIEGKKIGISKLWTRGAIWFFLTIVVLGYITTVYLLGKVIINLSFKAPTNYSTYKLSLKSVLQSSNNQNSRKIKLSTIFLKF